MAKVVKFGGSSLANGEQYEKVVNIVLADPDRRFVVVSAPGKRFDIDTKVTDLLIQYAKSEPGSADFLAVQKELISRYQNIAEYFKISEKDFAKIANIISNLSSSFSGDIDYRLAYFKAHGEHLNAILMAMVLNQLGHKARFAGPAELGLLVEGHPDAASVLEESYTNLNKFDYSDDEIIVVPGFYGMTKNGQMATFARGGSDITGSIVARGLGIKLYENFTDVSAVYVANPHIIDEPVSIKQMTYREMRELSYSGFSVFNDEAIIPAIQGQVTINVKNTNRPEDPGTLIVPEKDFEAEYPITGVTNSDHFSALYLHRYLLNQEVGMTLKLLQIFYKYDISYEHMPSGIDDLTVIFDNRQLNEEMIERLCADIKDALNPDVMQWIDDYTIIMIVGEGMFKKPTIITDAIASLTNNGVPINMINQGASQISTMLGTKRAYGKKAVSLIYQHFFNQNKEEA
ncbi:aspartate kinase [Fructobacillus sp. CRL 2054]|uniref:aspartate kinase n=1 Tax=Fructobacillus sp. CRL 2054 TaxID=2763007 RepID=UPI002378591F|nr:aspartate kinase [Fructobacillus sp. CRL 2054]MDD9138845.1 aspartate kinase [Fructobacillus sp. CRL 2054]